MRSKTLPGVESIKEILISKGVCCCHGDVMGQTGGLAHKGWQKEIALAKSFEMLPPLANTSKKGLTSLVF